MLTACSPGSRIWKVGFSGESDPRSVFWAQDDPDSEGGGMWDLNFERIPGVHGDRNEGHRLVGVRVVRKLRETFFR